MKKSRGHLTRQKISKEGLKLLNEAGLKGLSMRKLGSRLGVEAMSLYNHVKNKADLLDSIHEELLQELQRRLSTPGPDWKETVKHMARAFLGIMKEHPGSIPLFASRSAVAPGSLDFLDSALGVLRHAGLSPRESLMTFQSFFTMIVGHAMFHYAPREKSSYADLSAYQQYPHLQALDLAEPSDPDKEFEFGLDVVLSGLESRLSGS